MCGGRICHALLTVQKTHRRPLLFNRQQTLYWLFTQTKLSSSYRNKTIVTYAYMYWALMKREALRTIWAKLELAITFFILFCHEILESVWQQEENLKS